MQIGLADLLGSLTAIGHSLQEAFDPQRFLSEFSDPVQHLVPHDRLMISHLEEGGMVSVFAECARRGPLLHAGHYTIDFHPAGHYDADAQILGSVLAGEPMLVQDIQSDPRFSRPDGQPSTILRAGVRSRLAVPMRSGGRIVGTLSATSYDPGLYTQDHLVALQQVADLIAPFIQNIVLLHRERRRRRRLAAVTDLACVFGATLNIRERFDDLAEAIRPHLDFDVFGARLLGASGRDLEIVRQVGDGAAPAFPERISLDDVSFFPVIKAGKPVLIHDALREMDPGRPGDRAIIDGGARSNLLAPLRTCDDVVGYLFFVKRQPNWFNTSDVEIASAIAGQVIVALQHQRLASEQQERARAEGRARQLEARVASLREELAERYGFERIIGRAPVFREALDRAAKVAATETTVLLTGESGTGKELVARAIHHAGPRADGPYIAVNCAALSETLVESELFGHEKGAFTGADRQKPGRFELAGGGTLFLDEVGELPPAVQAKLLRVLQEHEFQRVGGTATLRANVRLIAATNRDLTKSVAEGKFREDLFYRLNVFGVPLPPLRERGEDILLLAHHFVREIGRRLGKGERPFSPDGQEALRAYGWPGNIRELENAIERALILTEGGALSAKDLGLGHADEAPGHVQVSAASVEATSLADMEKQAIRRALNETRGNKTRAAALLGITRTQLHTRLKRFGIS